MKKLALIIFLLLISFHIKATTCNAIGNGNWSTSSNWSCGRIPQGGDTINIPVGIGVTVSSNITITSPAILLNILGTLSFDNGKKITFPDNSIIYISSTGSILGGGGGGSSNLITIGTTDVWKAGDGDLYGPLYLTKTCYVNCVSLPAVFFSVERLNNLTNLYYYNTQTGTITFQKSYDLVNWYDIISIKGREYSYSDKDDNSIIYYRVKFETSKITYSDVKSISYNNIVFKIFPNPSTSEVFIGNNLNTPFNIIIYNVNGTKYLEAFTNNLSINFDRGIYYSIIWIGDKSYKEKIIIE